MLPRVWLGSGSRRGRGRVIVWSVIGTPVGVYHSCCDGHASTPKRTRGSGCARWRGRLQGLPRFVRTKGGSISCLVVGRWADRLVRSVIGQDGGHPARCYLVELPDGVGAGSLPTLTIGTRLPKWFGFRRGPTIRGTMSSGVGARSERELSASLKCTS